MRSSIEFEELSDSVDLVVHTKCPEKWILVDRETGEIYQGSPNGHWDRLNPIIKNKP